MCTVTLFINDLGKVKTVFHCRYFDVVHSFTPITVNLSVLYLDKVVVFLRNFSMVEGWTRDWVRNLKLFFLKGKNLK